MTRVLEFIVALIIVFIIAVIFALTLPSHSHIERSIHISHNPHQIYDVVNNFRRFDDYGSGQLVASDPNVKFTISGPAYGPGATISWQGNDTIGNGKLVNKSGNIAITNDSTVAWALTNDWHGKNKTYTIQVTPRQDQRVSTVTWSYDVDCGWNLICRYAQLWIHGAPATTIKMGLGSLQTMLAGIPNVDYANLETGLYQSKATPALLVSTEAPRTLDDIDTAKLTALGKIQDAMDKLGVKAAGPTRFITTEYGDTKYIFDVAVPINTTTISIDGKSHDLTQLPPPPTLADLAAPASSGTVASAASTASASSVASASSAGQPAPATSTGKPEAPKPGDLDKQNQLIVNADVRALMLPAQKVLEATWTGEAGVPLMRLALRAYAGTHGYQFNNTTNRIYDQLISLPTVADQDQVFRVFLPVQDAPAQTPEQIAGTIKPLAPLDPSLWGASPPSSAPPSSSKKSEHHKTRRHHR